MSKGRGKVIVQREGGQEVRRKKKGLDKKDSAKSQGEHSKK